MKKYAIVFAVLGALGAIALVQAAFTVQQTERAIVLQLGKPVAGPLGPGLHFKLPFVQNAMFFDSRILDYDAQPAEILTKDKKNMVVDNYTRWRIVDPLEFYRTLRTVPSAQARLDDIIYSELRAALGRYTLIEIVAEKRGEIMQEVTGKANKLVAEFGIEVIDVRIKRTDLPSENEQAIFGRMRAERERQAKRYRSEGQEEAAKIRAQADKKRTILIAEAKRQAEVLRGEGDAEAIRIFAGALKKAPDFYDFQRSLEAYRKAMSNGTTYVLTPDDPFLKYMK
ncbi:protease modulator HflC [Desulfohalovibrio reitneri]|uniref:protease modulator HflC n=1 Tax=Desulfohalovibrio reitneri TaxID=1307759 RepID=UPI0004A6FBF5|nr:protease modulator HflC [Desulfohalovibrio reitneri]